MLQTFNFEVKYNFVFDYLKVCVFSIILLILQMLTVEGLLLDGDGYFFPLSWLRILEPLFMLLNMCTVITDL